MQFKIQAPFANGLIILFAQLHLTMAGGLILIDFQQWKGDVDEFLRLYRELYLKVSDIVFRV
ncbi:hypothetical protein HK097_002338 [Rhizophlyctis rosea]|uniref:Uncharacterized protein n=1 Tax=Rhizophlyctis rosea TaxID=64517 RepID=A0AAD5X953_9FUNG|nr:hypothetical protein HK097_002338 [Rhizophlyctis rosea]